jgi:hypothetical protein
MQMLVLLPGQRIAFVAFAHFEAGETLRRKKDTQS